jgi:hypothetical protein
MSDGSVWCVVASISFHFGKYPRNKITPTGVHKNVCGNRIESWRFNVLVIILASRTNFSGASTFSPSIVPSRVLFLWKSQIISKRTCDSSLFGWLILKKREQVYWIDCRQEKFSSLARRRQLLKDGYVWEREKSWSKFESNTKRLFIMELKVKKYIKEKHHRAFHLSLYFPTGDSPTSGIYFALPQRPIELGI